MQPGAPRTWLASPAHQDGHRPPGSSLMKQANQVREATCMRGTFFHVPAWFCPHNAQQGLSLPRLLPGRPSWPALFPSILTVPPNGGEAKPWLQHFSCSARSALSVAPEPERFGVSAGSGLDWPLSTHSCPSRRAAVGRRHAFDFCQVKSRATYLNEGARYRLLWIKECRGGDLPGGFLFTLTVKARRASRNSSAFSTTHIQTGTSEPTAPYPAASARIRRAAEFPRTPVEEVIHPAPWRVASW